MQDLRSVFSSLVHAGELKRRWHGSASVETALASAAGRAAPPLTHPAPAGFHSLLRVPWALPTFDKMGEKTAPRVDIHSNRFNSLGMSPVSSWSPVPVVARSKTFSQVSFTRLHSHWFSYCLTHCLMVSIGFARCLTLFFHPHTVSCWLTYYITHTLSHTVSHTYCIIHTLSHTLLHLHPVSHPAALPMLCRVRSTNEWPRKRGTGSRLNAHKPSSGMTRGGIKCVRQTCRRTPNGKRRLWRMNDAGRGCLTTTRE